MATLTPAQLAELRRETCKGLNPDFTKPQINAMLQAIEDWFEAQRATLNAAVNAATSPFVFTAAQKKKALAYWMNQKFGRELV